ncbi:HPF/RaiA family ribosome-associated protein [Caldimonas tepidiphila]|uniref:HPF/RaiA family ribosome-associated protein n=1 Tax=Caldimonas tepidiphila TaxID=2315841 RepID=UPI000E5A1A94|nr:HPF/RaiA family ribosome-associated protein [Caldimonas tepidiphila]
MQIRIHAPCQDDAQSFRDGALARARFMLRRAAQEVIQARILLRDLNGPRGGIDQQCQVTLVTHSRGVLVVTSRAQSAGAALAQALHSAVQALVRAWQRQRRADRRGPRAGGSPARRGSACERDMEGGGEWA